MQRMNYIRRVRFPFYLKVVQLNWFLNSTKEIKNTPPIHNENGKILMEAESLPILERFTILKLLMYKKNSPAPDFEVLQNMLYHGH